MRESRSARAVQVGRKSGRRMHDAKRSESSPADMLLATLQTQWHLQ